MFDVGGLTSAGPLFPVVMAGALVLQLGLALVLCFRFMARLRVSGEEIASLRARGAELEHDVQELTSDKRRLEAALGSVSDGARAKVQFLANMSHELRTPLNAIIGFSEMLAMEIYGPLGDGRYKDYVTDIQGSGRHLLALVNDILDLSKVDAGRLDLQIDEIDAGEIVHDVVKMVEGEAKTAGIEITSDVAQGLPHTLGDERRIRQVLINLLSNAVKFTQAGGKVSVGAQIADGELVITVSDTGIGIAPADIPVALERFGQIDNSLSRHAQGTGLGLPLAKKLVELHGGTLNLDSLVDVGTCVTVRLPAGKVIADAAAEPSLARAAGSA